MEVGILGATIIMIAWLYEAYETYRKGHKLDTKFIGLYIVGLSLLTYYSYQIDAKVFLVLNGSILTLTIVELLLTLLKK